MTDRDLQLAWRLFNLNWIPVAGLGVVLSIGMHVGGFSIDLETFAPVIGVAVTSAFGAYLIYASALDGSRAKLSLALGGLSQVIFGVAFAGPLSYVVLACGFPLQDHALLAMDRALGFDARSVISFVNQNVTLSGALAFGYAMIKWPLLVLPIVLSLAGRFLRLQQFMLALSAAMVLTIVVSVFFPAIGNYQSLGWAASDVPNVNIDAFLRGQTDIPAVRDGSLRFLEVFKLAGVVTFPSFHAASAVLYAWAFAPVRIWGPIALVLNTLMLASTPVIGGHYLIDVIAGAAVAVLSILGAGILLRSVEGVKRQTAFSALVAAEKVHNICTL